MVPQAAPTQPAPATVHVTAVFVVPVTVAVNCCVPRRITVAEVGETVIATGVMVTVAVADLVLSACEVETTVTLFGLGAVEGAV
jgi:hypothetical protein